MFYILYLSTLPSTIPPFIFINNINANNSYQAVEELNMREMNDEEFKDAIEHAIATLTKPLDSVSKE